MTFHLAFKVTEVREDEHNPDHVQLYAVVEAPQEPKQQQQPKVIQIGIPEKDDVSNFGQKLQTSLTEAGLMPQQRKRPIAGISLYISAHQFIQLGRPSVGDLISIDAETLPRGFDAPAKSEE
jgi:hypothetical protein